MGAAALELPRGAWPVMVTPFNDDRTIDWAALDELTDWYLSAGAVGLFAVAQTSEMYALSPAERLSLAEAVVRRVDGRVPVIASGTFGGSIAAQAEGVEAMAGRGVAAVVVITSQLAGADEGDRILEERLSQLLEATESPLGLYECPLPYKRLVPADLLGRLASSGRFVFMKDTTERPSAIKEKVAAVSGTALHLYNAEMSSLLESLRSGAHGFCGNAMSYYPELIQWLCTHASAGAEQAERIQHLLTTVDAVVSSPLYPASAKHFLAAARGLKISPVCRVSGAGLREHDRRLLEHLDRHVRSLDLPVALT